MKDTVSTHRIGIVTQTVWVRLPDISPEFVYQLRSLYTQVIYDSLKLINQDNFSTKQVYSRLRSLQIYTTLSAKMLDRAIREAMIWLNLRKRERILTDSTLKRWENWGKKQKIPFPNVISGYPRLISFSEYLKGWPGSRYGQWPQTHSTGARFFFEDTNNLVSVSIDRVAIKTRAIVGGKPKKLLRNAIYKENGTKIGSSRLMVRDDIVQLAVPVKTQVKIPPISDLSQPTVVGVDLGINTLSAAVGISFDEKTIQ